jgi:hypothetical protein
MMSFSTETEEVLWTGAARKPGKYYGWPALVVKWLRHSPRDQEGMGSRGTCVI